MSLQPGDARTATSRSPFHPPSLSKSMPQGRPTRTSIYQRCWPVCVCVCVCGLVLQNTPGSMVLVQCLSLCKNASSGQAESRSSWDDHRCGRPSIPQCKSPAIGARGRPSLLFCMPFGPHGLLHAIEAGRNVFCNGVSLTLHMCVPGGNTDAPCRSRLPPHTLVCAKDYHLPPTGSVIGSVIGPTMKGTERYAA